MNIKLIKLTLLFFLALPFLGQAQYLSGVITGKFNPSGQLTWEKHAGGDGPGICLVLHSCSDAHANVYIVGRCTSGIWFGDTFVYGDLYVAKYDSLGNFIWANYYRHLACRRDCRRFRRKLLRDWPSRSIYSCYRYHRCENR
ncbi:MAG: hypothetical protein HQ541_21275 [Mariniphaga sp.]|nr:hypothetical protein [Mariniphaga sp.]